MVVRFCKGQALGNDYFVMDAAELPVPLTPARAVLLCDRHRGAGSDGVLLADLSADPVHLRIVNPDGTEAEKSGNGLRIFGAYMYRRGIAKLNEWFKVRLARDTVSMRVEEELEAGAVLIRVQMGPASFDGAEVGFIPEAGEVLEYDLDLPGGGSASINTVSLGNPHCVVFVDDLSRSDFLARAPLLCSHAAFASGTNVQFARVIGPRELEALIWERGANETLASGSSACAVASAAVRRGFVEPGQFVVQMAGGSVEVTVSDDFQVELLGPAQIVYDAQLTEGVAGSW